MSEIVEDLLKEVKELETATKELETTSQAAKNFDDELNLKHSELQSNMQRVNIEAIKAAQDAAKNSQRAAEASLQQGQKLKAEVFELSEANFNWRQSLRNALKDFKSAKTSVTVMLIISIIFSLAAAGAAGYFAYSIQKQNAQFKGEVLDIIATEQGLLKKGITLKVDELAAVIETMSYPEQPAKHSPQTMMQLPDQTEPQAQSSSNESMSQQDNTEPLIDLASEKSNDEKPKDTDMNGSTAEQENPVKPNSENDAETHKAEVTPASSEVITLTKEQSEALFVAVEWIKSHETYPAELKTLKTKFAELEKHFNTLKEVKGQQPTTSASLTPEQVKKLDGIGWLVRKQSKAIKELEKQLAGLKANGSNSSFSKQLKQIVAEQMTMRKELAKIEKSLDKLTELSKEPPPYSYRAK